MYHHSRFQLLKKALFRRNLSTLNIIDEGNVSKKWKKYLLIGSPLIVSAIFISSLFNVPPFRYFVEERWPFLVRYFRETYEYSDEDFPEMERVKYTNEMQQRPVNIKVCLTNGNTIEMHNVNATQSMSTLVQQIESTYQSSVKVIDFEDESNKEKLENIDSLVSRNVPGIVQLYVKAEFAPSSYQTIDPIITTKIEPSDIYFRKSADLFLSRYFNFIGCFLCDLRSMGLIESHRNQWTEGSREHNNDRWRRNKKTSKSNAIDKNSVLETIRKLEAKIKDHEKELRMGVREADKILADISKSEKEIVLLKRRHLNYFYFF